MTQTDEIKDVAIIGAGPAGLFTAFQCGLLKLSVAIIDSLPQAGGQIAALYPEKDILDVPGFSQITGCKLSQKLIRQAEQFPMDWHLKTQVHAIKKIDGLWQLKMDNEKTLQVKSIIIAAGGGSFKPKKPPFENIEAYEQTSIHYFVQNPMQYKGKNIMIIGGGDSAVDWAMQLTELGAYITLVHRRDKFRALPHHVEIIKQYAKEGRLNLQTGKQLSDIKGKAPYIDTVQIIDMDGCIEDFEIDHLMIFMGLSKDLGPIANWGLSESKTRIDVNPVTLQTAEEGIFAVGDVAYWNGKIPLIVTGFSEAAIAARNAFLHARPDEKLSKLHSTSMNIKA